MRASLARCRPGILHTFVRTITIGGSAIRRLVFSIRVVRLTVVSLANVRVGQNDHAVQMQLLQNHFVHTGLFDAEATGFDADTVEFNRATKVSQYVTRVELCQALLQSSRQVRTAKSHHLSRHFISPLDQRRSTRK